jgi:hypothetical protein
MKPFKLLVLFIFAVLLFSNVSYSQEGLSGGPGRHEALGSNPFILDPVIDLNNNPAWGGQYKNYMFANIGRGNGSWNELNDQWAGVNFGVGNKKEFNIGLVLNKFEDSWDLFNSDSAGGYKSGYIVRNGGIKAPILPLKILLGFNSPQMNLAIAPYFRSWSADSNVTNGTVSTTTKYTSSVLGAQLGGLFKMNGGWVEAAIDIKMHSAKYDEAVSSPASTDVRETEGGMTLGVYVRGYFTVNQTSKVKLVPYLSFGMGSYNLKVTTTPTAWTEILPKYSMIKFAGGLGINMPVLENGLLATGLSFGYDSYEKKVEDTTAYKNTRTEFILPKFNIGLEWKFTDWLVGRLGYSRSFISGSDKTDQNTGSPVVANTWEYKMAYSKDAYQTITTGLGLEFGRFCFDGLIGERYFKQGPYILGGTAEDLYGVISASYNFNR